MITKIIIRGYSVSWDQSGVRFNEYIHASEEVSSLNMGNMRCINLMQHEGFAIRQHSIIEYGCIFPRNNKNIGLVTFGWMVMIAWTNDCRKLSYYRKYYTSVIVFYGTEREYNHYHIILCSSFNEVPSYFERFDTNKCYWNDQWI